MKYAPIIHAVIALVAFNSEPCAAENSSVAETRIEADQGNGVSQFDLGRMYYIGDGVPRDHAEAMKWWRKAADQGNAEAQASLGFMYDSGDGISPDHLEAIKLYQKAADHGNG